MMKHKYDDSFFCEKRKWNNAAKSLATLHAKKKMAQCFEQCVSNRNAPASTSMATVISASWM